MDRGVDKQLISVFKNELLKNSTIRMVGTHNRGRQGTVAKADGKQIGFDYDHIDEQYLQALQIPISQGRNFSADFPSDSTHSVLINETFARRFFGGQQPIGQRLDLGDTQEALREIRNTEHHDGAAIACVLKFVEVGKETEAQEVAQEIRDLPRREAILKKLANRELVP